MKRYNELKSEKDKLDKKVQELFAENRELNYELSAYRTDTENIRRQDAEIRELHQSIRRLKHDMKNHLMVIASYLNAQEYAEAKVYTSEILNKLNAVHSYIETGNLLLNHIVNEKFADARSKGISVKAEIENLSFEKMQSIDFSAMFSNMLDNAIEACENETENKREMVVNIFRKRGYEVICVKNKISRSVFFDNPDLLSTKEDKNAHGMGIAQTKEIVRKYQGMCDFYEEEGYFCACAFIPQ